MLGDGSAPHLFALAPLRTWIWLLLHCGGVSPRYIAKLLGLIVATTVAIPLRLAEKLRYGASVAREPINEPPIFIIGFPRSGTTHLHNILTRDPRFGSVTNFQAATATFCLIGRGWVKQLFARVAPATRPMDNVKVGMDLPQEEEFAVANTCHMSWLHHFTFPRRAKMLFDRFVMMRGLTERELARWDQAFLVTLRKASILSGGRRLVLKSPTNTGRIAQLLRHFPDAKFIHIVRNPYAVLRSVSHLYSKFIPIHQLQTVSDRAIADHIIYCYRTMMQNFLKNRARIPGDSLVEIRFEDLEKSPVVELERIYAELGLPDFEAARRPIEAYLASLAGYRKNTFPADQALAEVVRQEWAFALEAWPYEPPDQDARRTAGRT